MTSWRIPSNSRRHELACRILGPTDAPGGLELAVEVRAADFAPGPTRSMEETCVRIACDSIRAALRDLRVNRLV